MTGEANGKWFSRAITVAVVVAMLGVCIALFVQGGNLAFAEVAPL